MVFVVIMIMILGQLSPNIAFAQLNTNDTKTWLDRDQNIKIVLRSIPVQPTIGTPSLLRFTVQNLETGKPLTNLSASVVILGVTRSQGTTFRLTNISAPDGNFSTNVIFRDIGSYQVITRIMSQTHNASILYSYCSTSSFYFECSWYIVILYHLGNRCSCHDGFLFGPKK